MSVAALLFALAVVASPVSAAPAASSRIPSFAHIYLIVMENHEYSSIVGTSRAPFINGLIHRYGLAGNYFAVTHPSQPNYLALFGGATFDVHDDAVHRLARPNLVDRLEAGGRSWHVYAQDVPGPCATLASHRGGRDLDGAGGSYVRKHEPAISFRDIASRPKRCARITHLASFDPAAANFELIVPNMINDMHDGTIAQGDAFLRDFVPRITTSPAFSNSLLLITWDEGSTSRRGGGKVATIVVASSVVAGFRSTVRHDHFSLLRTIEDAWGLTCLKRSCSANNLHEFFPASSGAG
jgi:hypothetical protein